MATKKQVTAANRNVKKPRSGRNRSARSPICRPSPQCPRQAGLGRGARKRRGGSSPKTRRSCTRSPSARTCRRSKMGRTSWPRRSATNAADGRAQLFLAAALPPCGRPPSSEPSSRLLGVPALPDALPPCLEAFGEFAILARALLAHALVLEASYCFSFFTFATCDGMQTSSVGTVLRDAPQPLPSANKRGQAVSAGQQAACSQAWQMCSDSTFMTRPSDEAGVVRGSRPLRGAGGRRRAWRPACWRSWPS